MILAFAIHMTLAQTSFDRGDVEKQPTETEKMRIRYMATYFASSQVSPSVVPNAKLVLPYGACTPGEYYPSPNSCEEYFQCDNDVLVAFKCPGGSHWDRTHRVCNHAEFAGCELVGEDGFDANEVDDGEFAVVGSQDDILSSATTPDPPPSTPPSTTPPPPTTTTTAKPTETTAAAVVPSEEASVPEAPAIQPADDTGMKVVCYFTNWAWYRPGLGKYVPEDIDPDLCTHINYGFAVLDKVKLIIKIHDSWADVDNEFFKRVAAMKKKGSKVLLALGGWNDSLGDHYHRLVKSKSARKNFIEEALKFIQKYDFDGLDLDWEYPVCWQTKCRDDAKSDKQDFLSLVIELKDVFKPHGLMVTAALSPNPKIIDLAYDLKELNKHLDLFNIMTYDYYGAWDKQTGHHSPLKHHPNHTHPEFSAETTMRHYAEGGVDKSKLVMGMPTYGRMFTVKDQSENFIGAKASAGNAGEFTRSPGFTSYYEICRYIQKDGYKVVRDEENRMGPYAFKGNQWVGYEDVESIRVKSEYIQKEGYGGGMIWALDLDDFNGFFCGQGRYPLLSEINRVLRGYKYRSSGTRQVPSKYVLYQPAIQQLPYQQPQLQQLAVQQPLTYVHSQSPLRHFYTFSYY